jgi:hypothetical protein
MSEYASTLRLLSEGRLSELVASIPADEAMGATLVSDTGESVEITAVRIGVTVLIQHNHASATSTGSIAVRSFTSELLASAALVMLASMVLTGQPDGDMGDESAEGDSDTATPAGDFMVI